MLCMCDRWSGEHSAAKGLAAHRGTTWRELGPDAINAGQLRLSTVDLGRVRSQCRSRTAAKLDSGTYVRYQMP